MRFAETEELGRELRLYSYVFIGDCSNQRQKKLKCVVKAPLASALRNSTGRSTRRNLYYKHK